MRLGWTVAPDLWALQLQGKGEMGGPYTLGADDNEHTCAGRADTQDSLEPERTAFRTEPFRVESSKPPTTFPKAD